MTGTTALKPVTGGAPQKMAGSFVNSFRIAAVADRLTAHLQFANVSNPTEFFSLCLALARGIDCAVASSEVPPNAQRLPLLLKQVCQHRKDIFLHSAILVLMISVKNACEFGWFQAKETEELSALANEVGTNFCSRGDLNTASGDSLSVMTVIMSRFYPLMKMGQILVSLEVKPGYGAYVKDFHILKNTTHSSQEKIRLFVAQIDNTETSACITSPQEANFLLNGKGVERRTNVAMDTGPQVPTNVTGMLKYGTNLLQAVGQFNGHYIIAVAFMSVTPLAGTPVLQDYVQPNIAASDPDSDIIEGPSRVSLNCPISYTRIRNPVKGQSCKHLQCFDFRNFVDINSRRPSWRCPHCNQHVCYTDLRVDQNIVKVLKEVGENVADVIISADGSWKALFKSDGHKESTNCAKQLPEQQEYASSSPIDPVVMDLTDDDLMDVDAIAFVDKKPFSATHGSQPVDPNLTVQSILDNAVTVDQDDFWSSVVDLESGPGTTIAGLGMQPLNPMPEPPRNFMTPALVTQSSSSALSRDVGSQSTNDLLLQLQQSQLQQSQQLVNNIEYGRLSQVPRNVSRNPIAVQALPAPSQTLQAQRATGHLDSMIANGSPLASQASMSSPLTSNGLNANSNMGRQYPIPRSQTNPLQSSLPLHHPSTSQPSQQVAGRQYAGAYRMSQTMQPQDIRRLHIRSPSPGVGQSSSPLPQQQAVQMTRQPPSVPVQLDTTRGDGMRTPLMSQRANVGAPQQMNPGSINVVDLSSDEWRPTGRMRGSITGQAAAAYGDMVIRATTPQQGQAPQQPQPNFASPPLPNNVPANLQAFLANSRSRNFYASQTPSSQMTPPATTNGGAGSASGLGSGSAQ
ncbi:E4 SUMO-protein ligase PIAL2 [Euphorbia lathyris]|uniref:E4 SUMO-protein ligase PIAL2 n=1 Tax=Euphorbia lathyris TaxID=212925 RepID=UPI0033136FE8